MVQCQIDAISNSKVEYNLLHNCNPCQLQLKYGLHNYIMLPPEILQCYWEGRREVSLLGFHLVGV